jgi:hypothetical protein
MNTSITRPATGGRCSSTLVNESNKLRAKESDWNLAGVSGLLTASRTRHSGHGRPNLQRQDASYGHEVVILESSDSEYLHESSSSLEDDEEGVEEARKPPASRVILEVSTLTSMFEKLCLCPTCGGKLTMSLKTVCLATSMVMTCNMRKCGFIHYSEPPAQVNIDSKDNRERSTDFAINILYVVGFLSVGDGGTEAARLLGLLGLANSTTMKTRSFTIIEERIGPAIRKVANDMLLENLIAEVTASKTLSPNDFELWERSLYDDEFVLDRCKYPKIQVSYDMAWQQRNSGHRYNSASGHGLLVGGLTRKPLILEVKSKLCSVCFHWKKKHQDLELEPIPEHRCPKNHDGTSSSMEPIACLDMIIKLFERRQVIVQDICLDDDASTRALLRWSNKDWMLNNNTTIVPTVPITKGKNKGNPQKRPDKGKLPRHIPEPKFLADPNHRRKVWTGDLIQLANGKVADKFTMTKMDATRLGKNYGYMIRALHRIPVDKYEDAGKAVLEHHFDNHDYCGPWCPRKRQTDEVRKQKARYYRNKADKNDAKLYDVLYEKLGRFITLERLLEVSHGLDTQVNESFNQSASWFAPKNKVYCSSMSLTNRLSMAIGINTLGVAEYFQRLFVSLGIIMTDDVRHYLTVKERARLKQLEKCKTKEQKKNRLKRKFLAATNDEAKAKKERATRAGTYKSGMNMADGTVDGYTLDDLKLAAMEQEPNNNNNKQKNAATRKNLVCPHCGRKGHATTHSKQCLHHNGAPKDIPAIAAGNNDDDMMEDNNMVGPIATAARNSLAQAVRDMDNYDSYPLTEDPPSDISLSAFEDAGTWDTDDEDPAALSGAI